MSHKSRVILGIESSCDDTSAAILKDNTILSNVTATQTIHEQYGGVVPELASRAHQQNIIPTVDVALKKAGIQLKDVDVIAFTQGPGLMGSLVVGTAFAKSISLALKKPLVAVNHMHAHILAHFIEDGSPSPNFPFLCLTVSGGHTQIIRVNAATDMEILGQTIDDAAGEAFDKTAKLLGFPYPGGPLIDKHAKNGDINKFKFAKPQLQGYDFSFSGLKTSVLYFLQKEVAKNPAFIADNIDDLSASVQETIIDILFNKLKKAALDTGIKDIAIAGGVSANSRLREKLTLLGKENGWNVFIPAFEYCTDNAAMVAMAGKFLADEGRFCDQSISANARLPFILH